MVSKNLLRGSVFITVLLFLVISINFVPVKAQTATNIRLENRDWSNFFAMSGGAPTELNYLNNWMTFSRIKYGVANKGTKPILYHDTAILRVHNSGATPLEISGLSINNVGGDIDFMIATPPALPHTINAGSYLDLSIQFTEDDEVDKAIVHKTLTITSNDATQPQTMVELYGAYMLEDEGSHEIDSIEIAQIFGFMIDLGFPLDSHFYRGDDWRINIGGDEVYSNYWRRADPNKPVYVRQLAAYHGCCTAQDSFGIGGTGGGTIAHNGSYGQSVLPYFINSTTLPNERIFPNVSTTSFDINISGFLSYRCEGQESTCNSHAVRFWPVTNHAGQVVPNTYYVLQDFVGAGCGAGSANCDFNDNIYLVTNLAPVNSYIDVRPRFSNFGDWYVAGTNFTLKFRAQNLNWWPTGNTTMTIQVPDGITINWVTPESGTCQTALPLITCDVGSVSRGTMATVNVNARGNNVGMYTFTSSISHPVAEFNLANNTQTKSFEIVAAAPTNTPVPPTPTATEVPPTATATEVPPTATATTVPPTATATDVPPTATDVTATPDINLLTNGGFEIDINPRDRQPDSWVLSNKSKDTQICNTATRIQAFEGNCAYRFTGVLGEKTQLAQVVNISGYTLNVNDTLKLSLQYRSSKVQPRLVVKVQVYYTNKALAKNGILTKQKTINSASSLYLPIQLPTITLQGKVQKVRVSLLNRASSGFILIDDIRLIYTSLP